MCHGHIDPSTLMRDAEARYRATAADPVETQKTWDRLGAWANAILHAIKGCATVLRPARR